MNPRRAIPVAFVAAALAGSVRVVGTQAGEGGGPAPLPAASATFAEAARTAATLPRLHSLLVSERGALVVERYYNGARASRLANVKSVSKSVIAALVGVAIDRGLLKGVQQPISDFFPVIPGAAAREKGAITIEDLLTMRSGLESTSSRNYGAWVRSPNWVRYALARPLSSPPGTTMEYSTGNSHLLSAILTKATSGSTWQFARTALATPLGFTLARWPQDPQGIYFGGNEMLLTPRQMIAFGELYRNRGMVGATRVLSDAWIDASFVPRGQSRWSGQRYGYGWWMRELDGRQTYYAWGFGGQFVFVVPELELVIAITSSTAVDNERRDHRDAIYELVERLIIEPAGARLRRGGQGRLPVAAAGEPVTSGPRT